MLIKSGIEGNNIFIEFLDNGDGIPESHKDKIFNAFFTTTSAANHSANETDSLVGTGLGLKILKDIIEAYGGQIYVAEPQNQFTTNIRIEIPKQS